MTDPGAFAYISTEYDLSHLGNLERAGRVSPSSWRGRGYGFSGNLEVLSPSLWPIPSPSWGAVHSGHTGRGESEVLEGARLDLLESCGALSESGAVAVAKEDGSTGAH